MPGKVDSTSIPNPRIPPPPNQTTTRPPPGTDWNDFARGFLFILAIALETAGVVLAATAAAAAKKRKAL